MGAFVTDADLGDDGDEYLLCFLIDARLSSGIDLVGPLSPFLKRRFDTAGVATWFTIHPTLTSALAV